MKRYNLYIFASLLVLFLFNACQDETFVKNKTAVEGVPVEVTLAFSREDVPEVTTRAILTEEDESKVYDVRIFIFDKDRNLEYTDIVKYGEGNTSKKGSITCKVTSGQKYIYAIANTEGGVGAFSGNIENIANVDGLKGLLSTLNKNTDQRLGGHLLMSGAYVEGNGQDASCVIGANGEPLSGVIKLKRVDSRITFKVGVKENSNITFVPKTWKVVNIPKTSNVFSAVSDASGEYFETGEKPFDNSAIEDTKYKGGSFTFYMYENRKNALHEITDYNERERQNKNDQGLNTTFINADPNATYVVLTGDYSDGNKTTASVRYTIHLGYVENVSDFNSLRNTIYTYKVTVVGVDNIILEVESSQPDSEKDFTEKQPGAEGSVVVAEQSISVDSHYEAKNVTFSKENLSNLSVIVSTPYTVGEEKFAIDAATGDVTSTMTNDYQWVKFVKTTNRSMLAKYPGNDRAVSVDNDLPTNDDGEHFLTIDQLLRQLHDKREDNNGYWDNGQVTYTAFVDEFYYDQKDDDWKKFVNVDDRKMYILCNTQFSKDQQSDLTTANIMISQRSIKTIYNKAASGYTTAWGIETVDETKGMPMKGTGTRTSKNGRYNTFQMLGFSNEENNGSWGTYLDLTSEEVNKLNYNYKKAEYACLQRNRDLNGNGKIDADEVRWYLPSTTQYTGLWIGKDALYPEARLFQKDPTLITDKSTNGGDGGANDNFRSNNHFISSNGIRFWAEEGAATGNTLFNVKISKFNYRCARNLGGYYTGVPREEESVEDYVIATLNNNRIVTSIDLTRVDPLALRRTIETNISSAPEHRGADLNRPYKKFEMKNATKGKCPEGYRVPNQRELSLIAGYSTGSLGSDYTRSCTYSDLTYKDNKYYVSYWNNNINIVSLDGNKDTSVSRCVKDID